MQQDDYLVFVEVRFAREELRRSGGISGQTNNKKF